MTTIQKNGRWFVAGFCALALAGGATLVNERLLAEKNTEKQQVYQPPRAADQRDLSTIFRQVSREALPSIVSIETRGKVVQAQKGDNDQFEELFGDNSPFRDFFKGNPQFKEFRQMKPHSMPRAQGTGSGFIIDPSGVILTNSHVVADAEQVKVKLQDGSEYIATEVKTDPRTDLAIVRIKPEGKLTALRFGDSDAMEIGDWVLAVGSPFGLDFSVTSGIISAKGRGPRIAEREDFIQTDAAINPGNSGGPLLNLNGEVIGVNTAISSRSGGNDGVGFAIPINLAHWVADQLVSKGAVSRGYLGVGIQAINSTIAKQLSLPVGHGVLVSQVMPASPAAEAKVEPGDVILKLNGKTVHDPHNLQGIVEQLQLGAKYPLEVKRDGKDVTLELTVKEMPKDLSLASFRGEENHEHAAKPETNSFDELGVSVQELSSEVAKSLGHQGSATHGVIITAVKEDSPAASAGLEAGMVITKVGSQKITAPADLQAALKNASLEKGVLLLVEHPQAGARFVVVKKEG